ncbi:Fido domain-containing protein [Balamuthia mandrillaris]
MTVQRRRRFVREAGSSALPTSTAGPTAAAAFFNIASCVGHRAKVERRTEPVVEKEQERRLEEQKQKLAQQQRAFREAEAWRQQLVDELYKDVTDDELDKATCWKRYAQPFSPSCSCSQVSALPEQVIASLKPRAARLAEKLGTDQGWSERKQDAFLSCYIYHSAGIEGNSLSLEDTSFFVEQKKLFGSHEFLSYVLGEQNIIEVRNLYQAMETLQLVDLLRILMTNGSSLPWINITRELLLDSVWTITKDAGTPSRSLRRHPVAVGAQKVVLPMPDELPILFAEYVVWIQHSISELKQKNRAPTPSNIDDDYIDGTRHALDLACDAHTRFVHIHPFADGNGRMARLLDALVMQQVGLPPPMFSRHHRQEYMNAVSAATIHGNYEPLCQMHLAAVVASLDAVEKLVAEGDPFASCNHSR